MIGRTTGSRTSGDVTLLAVDLGKTGCRVRVLSSCDENPLLEGVGEGAVGLADADGRSSAVAAIRRVLADLGDPSLEGALACVGAAGAVAGSAAEPLAEELLHCLGLTSCAVTSDAVTSHVGALCGQCGVVLSAGTGAVAIGVSSSGEVHMVDGLGQWLGDEGSGAWIGLEGLRAAMRALDGRGPATSLVDAAHRAFGDLTSLPSIINTADSVPRTAAGFAPQVVARLAADDVAADIVTRAASALARTTTAAAHRAGGGPAAFVGGLAHWGEPILGPWRSALTAAGIGVVEAMGTSLDGAATLAARRDLAHEACVLRRTRPG